MMSTQSWFPNYKNLLLGLKVYLEDDTRLAIEGNMSFSFEFPNNVQRTCMIFCMYKDWLRISYILAK